MFSSATFRNAVTQAPSPFSCGNRFGSAEATSKAGNREP